MNLFKNQIILFLTIGMVVGISATCSAMSAVPDPYDYGDAPESYGTLQSDTGASHAQSDFYLGRTVDVEFDGLPNPLALGDNSNGSDDEDGVFFNSILNPGKIASVDVYLSDLSGSRDIYLNAWMDFDQSGTWENPGEQIITGQRLVLGTNTLSFYIPAIAEIGDTFARFRVSTISGLDFLGFGGDGEVEDYMVTISKSAVPVPSSMLLLGTGLLCLMRTRRKQ